MTDRREIAIIPARGGSKRLPRKNILPLNGQPLIGYPIRAAQTSDIFDEVLVSTEDEEVGNIASNFGATVIDRPVELAQDQSSVVEVCMHILALPQYRLIERFCCIYATAAFVSPNDLLHARELMDGEPKADYVMGVSQYNYHPVQALREEDGYLTSMWPEYQEKKSQEYPELVASNGTIYWARTAAFFSDQSFYGSRLRGYRLDSVDIDTPEDYQMACELARKTARKIRGI